MKFLAAALFMTVTVLPTSLVAHRSRRPNITLFSSQGRSEAEPEGLALLRFGFETWGLGNRRLSDHRERPRRGITADPLPDGESEEVQEGETGRFDVDQAREKCNRVRCDSCEFFSSGHFATQAVR